VAPRIRLLAGSARRWAGVSTALLAAAAGPLLQRYWATAPQETALQRLLFLKTTLVVGGLLLIAHAGTQHPSRPPRRATQS
jgi:hypothetical protein